MWVRTQNKKALIDCKGPVFKIEEILIKTEADIIESLNKKGKIRHDSWGYCLTPSQKQRIKTRVNSVENKRYAVIEASNDGEQNILATYATEANALEALNKLEDTLNQVYYKDVFAFPEDKSNK